MVELDLETVDGADIHIILKIVICIVILALLFGVIEFYRRYPFISFYLGTLLFFVVIPLRSYSNGFEVDAIIKVLIIYIGYAIFSLWRISSISTDIFNENFSSFPLNAWFHRKLMGKLKGKVMEWLCFLILFLNILWAVFIDVSVQSYPNAACGLIVALTVPLPSSFGHGIPGWSVNGEEKRVDLIAPDTHYIWITLYTSWNFLFNWMWTLDLWFGAMHLFPCYVYSLVFRRPDLWMMVRVVNIWTANLRVPWKWTELLFGTEIIIKDEMVPIVWGSINLFFGLLYAVYY